jgi:hypothetical protein
MAYSKPGVVVLGQATHAIQYLGKGPFEIFEEPTGQWNFNPAYDLDE